MMLALNDSNFRFSMKFHLIFSCVELLLNCGEKIVGISLHVLFFVLCGACFMQGTVTYSGQLDGMNLHLPSFTVGGSGVSSSPLNPEEFNVLLLLLLCLHGFQLE